MLQENLLQVDKTKKFFFRRKTNFLLVGTKCWLCIKFHRSIQKQTSYLILKSISN